ncbi:MAG: OmpH family outer membrane protein [Hydrogenothermaceae bacterium]
MKKFLIVFTVVLAMVIKSFAGSYAYVDIDRVMNESNKGKKYKAELDAKLKYYQDKVKELSDKIQQIQKQLASPTLNEKAKEQKREELRQFARELQNLEGQANKELAKMKADAEISMVKDIKDIVKSLSQKNNYDIVFYGGLLSGILYANKGLDITDLVIKEYNSKK